METSKSGRRIIATFCPRRYGCPIGRRWREYFWPRYKSYQQDSLTLQKRDWCTQNSHWGTQLYSLNSELTHENIWHNNKSCDGLHVSRWRLISDSNGTSRTNSNPWRRNKVPQNGKVLCSKLDLRRFNSKARVTKALKYFLEMYQMLLKRRTINH